MFIHIGGDIVVRDQEVVLILDVNHIKRNRKKNYNFIDEVEKKLDVVKIIDNEDIKSLIVTKDKIYYSPISTATLKKRAIINNLSYSTNAELE